MKLLFCRKCQDVVKLQHELRSCKCGAVRGKYLDNLYAEVSPEAVVIGINNYSLAESLSQLPSSGPHRGPSVECWLMPKGAKHVTWNLLYEPADTEEDSIL